MLTNPTLDHMYTLGLSGMAAAWRELAEQPNARAMEKEEWLGLMLDREIAVRADKRLTARLVAAKLRFPEACVEDIDFHAARNLDRRATMALAQGQWLKNHENLIVTGKTGTGKSWLACALGRQAARHDHTVLYVRAPRLFEDLAMAKLDGRYPRCWFSRGTEPVFSPRIEPPSSMFFRSWFGQGIGFFSSLNFCCSRAGLEAETVVSSFQDMASVGQAIE